MIPLAVQLVHRYAVLRPRIARSARPEYVVAATVVSSQVLLGAGIAAHRRAAEPGHRR